MADTPASPRTRHLLWIWLLYWLCMFAATHTPVPEGLPPMPTGGDKAVHFGLYFGLTLLGGWRIIRTRRTPLGSALKKSDPALWHRVSTSVDTGYKPVPHVPQRTVGEAHRRHATTRWAALLLWAFIYVVYAALDEWTQRYVNRTPSLSDWTADMAGIVTGTLLLIARTRR